MKKYLLLALMALSVPAFADDTDQMYQLPRGSTLTLPLNATIAVGDTFLGLGFGDDLLNTVWCDLNFAASDQTRIIQGVLKTDFSGGQSTQSTLDGKPVAITITCSAHWDCQDDDVGSAECPYTGPSDIITIGDVRGYIENLGGTLDVPGPVPF